MNRGVRAPVWIALAASALTVAGTAAFLLGDSPHEEPRKQVAVRIVTEGSGPRGAVAVAPRTTRASTAREPLGARVETRPSPLPAEEPALEPPREDRRSPSLVGLEREAAGLAEAGGLLDGAQVEAQLAELEPARGEAPDDFDRRLEALRDRLGSEALLLESRLGELYATTVYPIGFPVEEVVAAQERQWIASLPEADREAMLRNALEEREVERAEPQFEPAESGRYWQGAQPGL